MEGTVQFDLWQDYLPLLRDEERQRFLERHEWDQEDINTLHESLLIESLRDLKSEKTSKATKDNIIRWVLKPLEDTADRFSFQACCILMGLNPVKMQNDLSWIIRKHCQ